MKKYDRHKCIMDLFNGKKELTAMMTRQSRVDGFKKSVVEGTHEQFLSQLHWEEKISLHIDMNLMRMGINSEPPYTPEEQTYHDIIQASIDKDTETFALSQGFKSVDAWKEHNARYCRQNPNLFY